uniref:Uncharacterized protein n=1 Tax=Chromera velia CCMP2878 TaxID=1169474 RepID=A0A0G4I2W3_9ALVE|eukprot:Cvel_10477.t1-p1 / transcript=Cvel_10477.t1 / gene=Cvel_10477 / organism=Chromera_velia_CCMP2878 / gene_product=hypothetical protein / transcript_product=hypothetical protein / location=Cvel_scaffold632:33477-34370(-) / protein_length=298 / sequence_SO=supercontig / SO=protein_coding / is_pseudo=false
MLEKDEKSKKDTTENTQQREIPWKDGAKQLLERCLNHAFEYGAKVSNAYGVADALVVTLHPHMRAQQTLWEKEMRAYSNEYETEDQTIPLLSFNDQTGQADWPKGSLRRGGSHTWLGYITVRSNEELQAVNTPQEITFPSKAMDSAPLSDADFPMKVGWDYAHCYHYTGFKNTLISGTDSRSISNIKHVTFQMAFLDLQQALASQHACQLAADDGIPMDESKGVQWEVFDRFKARFEQVAAGQYEGENELRAAATPVVKELLADLRAAVQQKAVSYKAEMELEGESGGDSEALDTEEA